MLKERFYTLFESRTNCFYRVSIHILDYCVFVRIYSIGQELPEDNIDSFLVPLTSFSFDRRCLNLAFIHDLACSFLNTYLRCSDNILYPYSKIVSFR